MTFFLDEALRLASLGYHVFQCVPKSKLPFAETAPEGCNSASGDPDVVRKWWTKYPDCNIGLKCDNLLVIDVDNKKGKDGSKDFTRIMDRLSGQQNEDGFDEEEEDEDAAFIVDDFRSDPGVVPDRLLRIPGFVSEVMDFSLENAPCAVPTTAFCGALALQSFLCGRKVREPGDLRTNLYLLALVGASSGKDYPRKVNTHVMEQIGEVAALGDKFMSGEGLQDSLFAQPSMLYQNDEIDELLFKLNDRNSTPNASSKSTGSRRRGGPKRS